METASLDLAREPLEVKRYGMHVAAKKSPFGELPLTF
jgi:hypothetical protein